MRWGTIVLAGGEAPIALARAIGTRRKALAPFDSQTSLSLTLRAVREADLGPCVVVSGPDVGEAALGFPILLEGGSAIDNALIGAAALSEAEGLLYLPADTPLLRGWMLASFATQVENAIADSSARWYAAGISRAAEFVRRYPGFPIRALRLREGPYVSGALFASSHCGLAHGAALFRAARRERKNQIALARRFGIWNLARYLMGRVSIPEAERIIGQALGGSVRIVSDVDPATCLDFDTAEEYEMIRSLGRFEGET